MYLALNYSLFRFLHHGDVGRGQDKQEHYKKTLK